jgi:hypothetical protein
LPCEGCRIGTKSGRIKIIIIIIIIIISIITEGLLSIADEALNIAAGSDIGLHHESSA